MLVYSLYPPTISFFHILLCPHSWCIANGRYPNGPKRRGMCWNWYEFEEIMWASQELCREVSDLCTFYIAVHDTSQLTSCRTILLCTTITVRCELISIEFTQSGLIHRNKMGTGVSLRSMGDVCNIHSSCGSLLFFLLLLIMLYRTISVKHISGKFHK